MRPVLPPRLLLVPVIGLAFWACGPKPPEPRGLGEAVDSRFRPGQRWKYLNREGEEDSRLIVLKVENDPKTGNIVHVRVAGLRVKSPGGFIDSVGHLPLTEAALESSVMESDGELAEPPGLPPGYESWKNRYLSGSGEGVIETQVADSVSKIEAILNSSDGKNAPATGQ